MSVQNFFTVDLEDWYHITGLSKDNDANRSNEGLENRVVSNTHRLLSILRSHNIKATFFVLGIIAEKNPGLIRKIHEEGHEIASHGYNHIPLMDLSPEEFRKDINSTSELLKCIIGYAPRGFRAPSFSVTEQTKWALDILGEEGYLYDASIFPAKRDNGGLISGSRTIADIDLASGKKIKEFPVSVAGILGLKIPFSGGGYFRALPYFITRQLFKSFNAQGVPVMFYIHPRDIDVEQPHLKMGFLKSIKCYIGLHNAENKLKKLLNSFNFGPIGGQL